MIEQQHSGSGDNVAGNKSTKNYIAINSVWIAAIVILIVLGAWLIPGLWPKPVALTGYVLSNAQVPEPGVRISVRSPGQPAVETFTDENGFFRLEEINLRKVDSIDIEATLKERSVSRSFGQLGPETGRLTLQLPPGTPPFEVSYYDISGVSLNYLFDAKVDEAWEKRLGGQPFIIPNEVYQAFKDLGERFAYPNTWEGVSILDPENGMSEIRNTGQPFSRILRGVATNQPYNGNSQEYDYLEVTNQTALDLIRQIDGWRAYSTSTQSFEPVAKERLIALQQRADAALRQHDSNQSFDILDTLSRIWAPLSAAEIAFIHETTDGRNPNIIDYVSRDGLPEGFLWTHFAAGCGGGELLLITQPTYRVKVAVLENNTADPVSLDSFYIRTNPGPGLRSEKANPEQETMVKRLFPKNTLNPGDKLLIPVAIRFTASQETEEYEYLNEEFYYGPSWSVEQVRVENQLFPFRQKDSDLVALYFGGQVGSCPYAYTFSEEKGYWMLEDHILFGRNAREKIGYDEIRLKRFQGELLIKEEDPETSYIDLIEIRLETEDGRSQRLTTGHALLRDRDGKSFRMDQGDEIKLRFEDFDPDLSGHYYLRSFGYYEPYPMATD